MSAASVGCSQPRPCSGRKQMRRCGNSQGIENVVLIDVDGDSLDNVIVIDVPESLPTKFRQSNVLRNERKGPRPRETVICLDNEENIVSNYAHNGVKIDSISNNGASSSMRHCSTSANLGKSSDAVGDECQFVQENASPVKLSKRKRTYSGKASDRNQYGLNTGSESSSDSDCPDCELMEDFFGTYREQWEKASSKRKCNVHNRKSCVRDPDLVFSAARTNGHISTNCSQPKETTSEGKGDGENQAQAFFTPKGNGNLGCASDLDNGTSFESDDYLLESILKTRFFSDKHKCFYFGGSRIHDPPFEGAEYHTAKNFEQGGLNFYKVEKQDPEWPSSFPYDEAGTSQVNDVGKESQYREKNKGLGKPCLSKPQSCSQQHYSSKANLSEKEPSVSKYVHSDSRCFDHGTSNSGDTGKIFSETTSNYNIQYPWTLRDIIYSHQKKLASQRASSLKTRLSDKCVIDNGFTAYRDKDGLSPGETLFHKSSVLRVENCDQKDSNPLNREQVHKNTSVCSSHINEVQAGQAHSCSVNAEEEPVSSMHKCEQEDLRDDPVHGQTGDTVINTDGCIISEREKLKKTDEYKKAMEEEWASRQRALQVQAEEAQQLRRLQKRRKAESLRLLDTERRQKQRLEEIRETQKKDEENMNLKEAIRAEVRKELIKLEITCHDMASVLRELGILVAGGLHSSVNEVRSAYKRALLTFHPDRASRSDVRQLVEAEEKFKLISRMKEKFLPI